MTHIPSSLLQVDITAIGAFIGSVGFPVALACGLLYYLFKVQKAHKEETDMLKNAINELNLTLSKILEHIRKEDVL